MKLKLSLIVLALMGAFALVVLSGAPLPYAAQAQSSPAVAVSLSSASVEQGTAITVTMKFSNLETDTDTATKDYIFRADVKDPESGDADVCEDQANGYGLGVDRYMHQVDEDPEVRTGSVSAGCPAGEYTLRASISSADNEELASASASFTVTEPEPPPSGDAALSGLELSGVDIGTFDPDTTGYNAEVANDVAETTVTATANDGGATYVIKLDGAEDADGTVDLAVGRNVITVEVTAEDGETTQTYTVTVTRAAAEETPSAALVLSPVGFAPWNSEIGVTMFFSGLERDSDRDTTDYIFRADVKDSDNADAEACEGEGLGLDRYMYQVDQDPETRTGTISAGCPIGGYTVDARLSSPEGAELASASAGFSVIAPSIGLAIPPTEQGAGSVLTLTFGSLAPDNDAGLTYRADVKDSENEDADRCEGDGLGVDQGIQVVDDDPEVRTGAVSADCPAGDYTLDVSISSAGGVKLASATASFAVSAPAPEPTPEPSPTPEPTREPTPEPTPQDDEATGEGESFPLVAIALFPSSSVEQGTAIEVTMAFSGLETDSDKSTRDYIFRADVKGPESGDADGCEDRANGYGLGVDRYINLVDEDMETRSGTVSAECPAGDYSLEVSVSSPDGTELAQAAASFTVAEEEGEGEDEPPTSEEQQSMPTLDITLSGGNDNAQDIWSDSTIIWVLDADDNSLVLRLRPGRRDAPGRDRRHR